MQQEPGAARHAHAVPGVTERGITLAEFEEYLRTVNNRDGRPYAEMTINAYVAPARHLDAWLTERGIEGDFTVADTALLNRYFREYYLERGQGGTHTAQRNLIQLFNFLARERDHPTPYTDGLNRYAEVKGREAPHRRGHRRPASCRRCPAGPGQRYRRPGRRVRRPGPAR